MTHPIAPTYLFSSTTSLIPIFSHTGMPAQFKDIPTEIVSYVCANLNDPADLAALASTSSFLRLEATRTLYTTIKLGSLTQTVRFCRTITWHTRAISSDSRREHPAVHVRGLTFRPRALHTGFPPVTHQSRGLAIGKAPHPTAAFFRLFSSAIAALPHLTTLDLAWGFLYRHLHPMWTLDFIGTHQNLHTFHVDGVEDANTLERFLARHRPNGEGGCQGVQSFENRSWLDLLDPAFPQSSQVPKHFIPGLLPVAKSFAGPVSVLKSLGVCANQLDRVRVWSWGYGSANEELEGIHETLARNKERPVGGRAGCGVADFAYVSKTLTEDIITLVGTHLCDVVHLTLEGYEPGRTPLPEQLPDLPNLESITIIGQAIRPTEKPPKYPSVTFTETSFGSWSSGTVIPPFQEGSTAQSADTSERQEAYSKAWFECRHTSAPRLKCDIWRPGSEDFHSMGP